MIWPGRRPSDLKLWRRWHRQRVLTATLYVRDAEFGVAEDVRQVRCSRQDGRKDTLGMMDALAAAEGKAIMRRAFLRLSIVVVGQTGCRL